MTVWVSTAVSSSSSESGPALTVTSWGVLQFVVVNASVAGCTVTSLLSLAMVTDTPAAGRVLSTTV